MTVNISICRKRQNGGYVHLLFVLVTLDELVHFYEPVHEIGSVCHGVLELVVFSLLNVATANLLENLKSLRNSSVFSDLKM